MHAKLCSLRFAHATAVRVAAIVAVLLGAVVAPSSAATDPALWHPTSLNAQAPARYRVAFKTTAGTFVVSVTRAWAPIGADRFYNLVKHRYFDGNSFFRVLPGFVVQFGLTGNPALDKIWQAASIPDDPVRQSNLLGYVTFAAEPLPNTRTTQLFINLGNNARLDRSGFAPFGRVTSGMDAVSNIYGGYGQTPNQDEIMSSGSAYLKANFPRLD